MSDAAINKTVKKSTEPRKVGTKYFMRFLLSRKVIMTGLVHLDLKFNAVISRFFQQWETKIGSKNQVP